MGKNGAQPDSGLVVGWLLGIVYIAISKLLAAPKELLKKSFFGKCSQPELFSATTDEHGL